jgi:hypothetical protein
VSSVQLPDPNNVRCASGNIVCVPRGSEEEAVKTKCGRVEGGWGGYLLKLILLLKNSVNRPMASPRAPPRMQPRMRASCRSGVVDMGVGSKVMVVMISRCNGHIKAFKQNGAIGMAYTSQDVCIHQWLTS